VSTLFSEVFPLHDLVAVWESILAADDRASALVRKT
jgi:hypothetical protein